MKSIIVYSFMIKVLKLKGSELLVYALIYSFSQFNQICYMKAESISKALGISRSQVFRAISVLLSKGLILTADNCGGYISNNSDIFKETTSSDLDELIRIAKTPWISE